MISWKNFFRLLGYGTALAAAIVLFWQVKWDIILGLNFSVVLEYYDVFLNGLLASLGITAAAIVGGFCAGTLLAGLFQVAPRPARWLIVGYVEILRDTPLLVQLIWIHFALPSLTGVNTSPLQSGLVAIVLQSSAYFTEIMRAGIAAVPGGQIEAAQSLGLPSRIRWAKIVLPQALQIVIPPMVSLMIGIFKATAILTVLQINELMSSATRISNSTFRPIEVFTSVAVIYFVVGYALSMYTLRIERRLLARTR